MNPRKLSRPDAQNEEKDDMAGDAQHFFVDLCGPANRKKRKCEEPTKSDLMHQMRKPHTIPSCATNLFTTSALSVGIPVSNSAAFLPGSQQTQDKITWLELGLCKSLVRAVMHLGFLAPTPVQALAIPAALRGKDVCARSATGSGKTAAFLLPLCHLLLTRLPQKADAMRSTRRFIRSLVLVPSRELGVQCENMLKRLLQFSSKLTVALTIGGVAPTAQEAALDASPDILIATPGRLVDHIYHFRGLGLDISGVEIIVLDECDKMLTVTLANQVVDILHHIPEETRQILMFSATMTEDVDRFAEMQLFEAHNVDVGHVALQSKLRQQFVRVDLSIKIEPQNCTTAKEQKQLEEKNEEKGKRTRFNNVREEHQKNGDPFPSASEGEVTPHQMAVAKSRCILALLKNYFKEKTIVFCKFKSTVHRLSLLLSALNFPVVEIQSDQEQEKRLDALRKFSAGEVRYLITTDVASKGLDIPFVTTVINYDLPPTLTAYIYRVGRTARVGAEGIAVSLVDETNDGEIMQKILAISGAVNEYQVALAERRDIPKAMLLEAQNEMSKVFPWVKTQLEAEELEDRIQKTEKKYGSSNSFVDEVSVKPQKVWVLSKTEERQRKEQARALYEKEAEIAIHRYQNILSNLDGEEMRFLKQQKYHRRAKQQKQETQVRKENAKRAELRKKDAKKVERNVIKKMKKKKLRAAASERRAEDREKKGHKPYIRKQRTKRKVKNRRRSSVKKH